MRVPVNEPERADARPMKPVPAAFDLVDRGQNLFSLEGELTFATAAAALKKTARLFRGGGEFRFDLAGIGRVDSAGVGLLLEWMRRAEEADAGLRFAHLPEHLRAIARVSGVEELLDK
jgi:phospholipid transport system transporter-binding protein